MKNKININLGCGRNLAPGFINVDGFITFKQIKKVYKKEKIKIPKNAKFVHAKVQNLPFKSNYADYVESIDMIEHLPMKELSKAFSEMYRVLKPGGMLRIITTSFDDVVRSWLDASRELTDLLSRGEDITKEFDESYSVISKNGWVELAKKRVNLAMMVLYGNQFHGGEYHMNAFTPAIMFIYLTKCGFDKKRIKLVVHEKGTLAPSFPGSTILKSLNLALINDTIVVEAIK
jgi:SAM-dependent methyltransferase